MKILKIGNIVIAIGAVLILAGALSANTMTLGIAKDTYVVGTGVENQWQNRGAFGEVQIGTHAPGWGELRGLLQFDTSSIPAGQTIQSATLRVYHYWDITYFNHSRPNATSIYRSLVGWDEKTDTSSGPGKLPGLDGNPDMCNFGFRMPGTGIPGIPWASGGVDDGFGNIDYYGPLPDGSDFVATPTDTVDVYGGWNEGNFYFGWVEFNVTADVAAWYSGAATNNGWLMKGDEGLDGDVGLVWNFYSREDTSNPSLHPQLVVNYNIPEPMTMCLFGLGGLALIRRKHA